MQITENRPPVEAPRPQAAPSGVDSPAPASEPVDVVELSNEEETAADGQVPMFTDDTGSSGPSQPAGQPSSSGNLLQVAGNPSAQFVARVQGALDRVPQNLQDDLAAGGYRVIAGGTVADGPWVPGNPLHLSGYGGYQWGKDLFVPERALQIQPGESEPPDYTFRPIGGDPSFALLHEVGHGLDDLKGADGVRLSQQSAFADAFAQDFAGVTRADEQEKYKDQVEVFASLFAASRLAATGYPDAGSARESARLLELFPNAAAAMRAALGLG